MAVTTCRHCKRLYNSLFGENLCTQCKEELEEVFKDVKDFVRDHPGVTIPQTIEHFNNSFVTDRQLREWVAEDRLQYSGEYQGIFCKNCGRAIVSGTLCPDCKLATTKALSNAFLEDKPKEKATTQVSVKKTERMRFLGS